MITYRWFSMRNVLVFSNIFLFRTNCLANFYIDNRPRFGVIEVFAQFEDSPMVALVREFSCVDYADFGFTDEGECPFFMTLSQLNTTPIWINCKSLRYKCVVFDRTGDDFTVGLCVEGFFHN